jgi:hypothetical protein
MPRYRLASVVHVDGARPIKVYERRERGQLDSVFRVVYATSRVEGLTQAAMQRELGRCMFHAMAYAGHVLRPQGQTLVYD